MKKDDSNLSATQVAGQHAPRTARRSPRTANDGMEADPALVLGKFVALLAASDQLASEADALLKGCEGVVSMQAALAAVNILERRVQFLKSTVLTKSKNDFQAVRKRYLDETA